MTERREPRAIVITNEYDTHHVESVARHLEEDDLLVVNPTKIIEGQELSFEMDSRNGLQVTYDDVALNGIRGVWYRRPQAIQPSMLPPQDKVSRELSMRSLERFNQLLLGALPEATWVSDYYAMVRAGNKTLQLETAQRLGFNIPDTLITSSNEAAQRFVDDHPDTVVKSLATGLITNEEGRPIRIPTTKYDSNKHKVRGLELSPAILQQMIDPDIELRVTVVDGKIFTAAISDTDNPSSGVRDWRESYSAEGSTLTFEEYTELPQELQEKCAVLVRELKLKYGAIDLIRDKRGIFWFLEVNSGGQYAFVENDTGLLIGKAVAELLVAGSSKG